MASPATSNGLFPRTSIRLDPRGTGPSSSDAHVDGHHLLVFTEAESVTDFSLALPDGDAPLHFDVFAASSGGGEVLVFASGDAKSGSPPFWGWARITPKS